MRRSESEDDSTLPQQEEKQQQAEQQTEEEPARIVSSAVGSVRQEAALDDGDNAGSGGSSSEPPAVRETEEEKEEDSAASLPFDELELPVRVFIGSYSGAVYALETVSSVRQLLAVAAAAVPSPPAASASPPSFFTLWSTDVHRASVQSLAVSPCGARLASSGVDETIQLFSLSVSPSHPNARHHGSLHRHHGSVSGLLLPSAALLLSCSADGSIAVFSASRHWEMTQKLQAHAGGVSSMALHQSGNALLSTGRDGTLRVWDLSRGQQAASRPLTEAGGSTAAEDAIVSWEEQGDGYLLARGRLITVHSQRGQETQRISSPSRLLAALYLQQGLVVGACEDGTVRVWSVQQGGQQTGEGRHDARVRGLDCLRVSGSALVVSASTDGQVWLWRLTAGGELQRLAGARSSLRITSVCLGWRWDARRQEQQEAALELKEQQEAGSLQEGQEAGDIEAETEAARVEKKRRRNERRKQQKLQALQQKLRQKGVELNIKPQQRRQQEEQKTPVEDEQRKKKKRKRVNGGASQVTAALRPPSVTSTAKDSGKVQQAAAAAKVRPNGISIVNKKRRAQ